MSTNCIRCVKNKRTDIDLLCDSCRQEEDRLKVKCPQCNHPLQKVRQSAGSPLNSDQFDACKAGDWFCEKCLSNGRGNNNFCYWWNSEVKIPLTLAQISSPDAKLAICEKLGLKFGVMKEAGKDPYLTHTIEPGSPLDNMPELNNRIHLEVALRFYAKQWHTETQGVSSAGNLYGSQQ